MLTDIFIGVIYTCDYDSEFHYILQDHAEKLIPVDEFIEN